METSLVLSNVAREFALIEDARAANFHCSVGPTDGKVARQIWHMLCSDGRNKLSHF